MKKRQLHHWLMVFLLLTGFTAGDLQAQEKPEVDHSYKPLTLKLSEDGSKYVRFIIWHQQWVQTNNLAITETPPSCSCTTPGRNSRSPTTTPSI